MNRSKTSLFLMELIIAILFFSIACIVCVQIFLKSHQLSVKSESLSAAVLWCGNMAEIFDGCDGSLTEMATVLKDTDHFQVELPSAQVLQVAFDKEWNPVTIDSAASSAYYVTCQSFTNGNIKTISITASDTSQELYQLSSEIYIAP